MALHVGTLFSILVVYRSDLFRLTHQPRLFSAIVIATLPIVWVGFYFKEQIEQYFDSPLLAGCGLMVTAVLLLLGQKLERTQSELETMSVTEPFVIGLFQAVAIVPGISRSGSTISAGLLAGLPRQSAATFSFFIAIPAIAGAAVLVAKDVWEQGMDGSPATMLVGAATSFLVGVAALRWLLRVVSRGMLHWFAYYCLVVGCLTIAWQVKSRFS